MASNSLISESGDPLQGLIGPSLFPRTIRASTNGPIPSDSKDLNSIHHFMKSLDLRSPAKVMNEAKRIVDGGVELLGSNLISFAETVDTSADIVIKGKDKPQERRQGLGLARKRARFSLKPSASQPSVNLESTLDTDQLQDPDEYFDAYEKLEYAKKEIQRQQGGSMKDLNEYKPSTNTRHRRPGILGKSYSYKHRYSSVPSENDDMITSSKETMETDILDAPNHDLLQKLNNSDPIQDVNLQDVELVGSISKTGNKVNDVLDELLSCNDEDLDGDGALNILQEVFQIKPLDLDGLCIPKHRDVRRIDFMASKESLLNPHKTSLVTNSLLKSVSGKPPFGQGQVAQNPTDSVASPTPPRSPFASLSLLKKRILQSNPLRDPFTPLNVDLSPNQNANPVQPIDKLRDQVDEQKESSMCSKKKARVEVEITEPAINMNIQKVNTGSLDCLPDQFVDENASGQSVESKITETTINMATQKLKTLSSDCLDQFVDDNACRQTAKPTIAGPSINKDMTKVKTGSSDCLPDQFVDENASRQNAKSTITEPTIMDTEMVKTGSSDTLPDQDENASRQSAKADICPDEEPRYNVEEETIGENLNGGQNIFDQSTCCALEDVVKDPSRRQQFDREQELEINQDKLQKAKREAGEKRLRKAHPLRKSLAESGTSFENGVRRSKRIRMRPLEYWKGERFLYGRLDESLKLVGVKYISPGKGDGMLKVKPYVSPQYKELLELASQH
ncbi:centromere protein C [Abeliophyllum distichum]|uniref:Centromere protein C n=1 Tax=Abeliophyllum distichum TaxID=126358 RepID=A0ABD1VAB5_9LAMI